MSLSSFPPLLLDALVRCIGLEQQQHFDSALEIVDHALRQIPATHALPLQMKRIALLCTLERHEEALSSVEDCLAMHPGFADAHLLRDSVANHLISASGRQLADAVGLKRSTLMQQRARAWTALSRYAEAAEDLSVAGQIEPDNLPILHALANAQLAAQRHDAALATFEQLLAKAPANPEGWFNRGNVLQQMHRLDLALDSYQSAQHYRPDFAEAEVEQAHCYLLCGDFASGWTHYEARWRTRQMQRHYLSQAGAAWHGGALAPGETLLIWAEQGLGDTIQFVRYLPLLRQYTGRDGRIVLRVPAQLLRLFAALQSDWGIEVVPHTGESITHDYHCPLLSLPRHCQTLALTDVPASLGYLRGAMPASATISQHSRQPLRIGLVWSGNQQSKPNLTRDIPFAALLPLFELPVTWVILQKDISAHDQALLTEARLNAKAATLEQPDLSNYDMALTAALIDQLDLVVSVDTAVLHLAAALGKLALLMLRKSSEWRWLLNRTDSPWYPTLQILRQARHGVWSDVIADTVRAIEERMQ